LPWQPGSARAAARQPGSPADCELDNPAGRVQTAVRSIGAVDPLGFLGSARNSLARPRNRSQKGRSHMDRFLDFALNSQSGSYVIRFVMSLGYLFFIFLIYDTVSSMKSGRK
jgi:hypothetical protein